MGEKQGKSKKWIVLARNKKNNNVRRVWTRVNAKGERVFKWRQNNPDPEAEPAWKCRMKDKALAQEAFDWAEGEGYAAWGPTKDKWPFLVLNTGSGYDWGKKDSYNKKLNNIAQRCQRYMKVSITRTKKEAYNLRMAYLNGTGNLAAKCCYIDGKHSWEQCQKSYSSCFSNHCSGKASDSSIYSQGRSGTITSVGSWGNGKGRDAIKKEGCCLPVNGEPWHVEEGNTWRA